MNMTVHDFYEAKLDPQIKYVYRLYNAKYKTSLVYGKKVIYASPSLYYNLKTYIPYAWPIITDDKFWSNKLRYIFTSSANDDKKKFLTKWITVWFQNAWPERSFKKAEVFKKNIYKNVLPSRIRFSVTTELIMLGEDTLDIITHCFAKQQYTNLQKILRAVFLE